MKQFFYSLYTLIDGFDGFLWLKSIYALTNFTFEKRAVIPNLMIVQSFVAYVSNFRFFEPKMEQYHRKILIVAFYRLSNTFI